MKKLSKLILLIMTTLSIDSYALNGYVELGSEAEDYAGSYENEDFLMPYIKTKWADIIPGSPFYMEVNYYYRMREYDGEYENDKRRREELFFGYEWKWEKFKFSPKVGIRKEDYASKNAKYDSQDFYRIYPNMEYRFNDKYTWYVDGYFAPVVSKMNNSKKRGNDDTGKTYNNDWKNELESGIKIKTTDDQYLFIGGYSEYDSMESDYVREEWQLRLRYRIPINKKFIIEPFARIDLYRQERDENSSNSKNQMRNRYGSLGEYKLTDTFSLQLEIYYEVANQEGYTNDEDRSTKEYMFYKIGFRQEF